MRLSRILARLAGGGRDVLVEMAVVAGYVVFTVAVAAAALWLIGP